MHSTVVPWRWRAVACEAAHTRLRTGNKGGTGGRRERDRYSASAKRRKTPQGVVDKSGAEGQCK